MKVMNEFRLDLSKKEHRDFMFKKMMEFLNLEQEEYFPTVNSSISWYIIKNTDNNKNKTRINDKTDLVINESLLYLPNDFNLLSLSIHTKVMFDIKDKLQE